MINLYCSKAGLLVEEVVVDFDLGVGFEVIWEQHDRDRYLAEIINLKAVDTCQNHHIHTKWI